MAPPVGGVAAAPRCRKRQSKGRPGAQDQEGPALLCGRLEVVYTSNRAMPECCAKKCKMQTKRLDLTGERQQQLHATHAVSPIAATLQVLPVSCLECDLFRPITRPSGCLSGASLVVGRASLASGCQACAAAHILSCGGCQRQSRALVSCACACQQCAFSSADCLLWMGKAQKPETMSAEVRRYVCSLRAPNAQRLRLATRITTRRFSTHFRCARVNRHQGMQTCANGNAVSPFRERQQPLTTICRT